MMGILVARSDAAEVRDETPKPDFYADFDAGANAIDGAGKAVTPKLEQNLKFVDGVAGKAVYIGGNGNGNRAASPALEYPADSRFDAAEGTVMFWVQPDWDGSTAPLNDNYRLFYAGAKFDIFMYAWLRVDLGFENEKKESLLNLYSPTRGAWQKGDWWHVTLSWNKSGWTKLYVNGLPFTTGWGYRPGPQITDKPLSFGSVRNFALGCTFAGDPMDNMRANAAFDELKIYKQALGDDAIMAEYRRSMPFDFVLSRRFLRANQDEELALDVWPGGQMIKPASGKAVSTPAKAGLDLSILKENGEVVSQKHVDLEISALQTVVAHVPKLPEGKYRLCCLVKAGDRQYRTSYPFYTYEQQPAPETSREDYKLGEPVFELDCTNPTPAPLSAGETNVVKESTAGSYREATEKRDSRFAYELDLKSAGKFDGSPMVLEVYWPDDKPRSMGLYLYPKTTVQQDRDRLAGGIQSGVEYSLSEKTQVTRYLFYPWVDKYLFEARTMVNDYPAAVSKIVVRPVLGRLPKLAVNSPKDFPKRYFGHLDEDQSLDALLALDMKATPERRVVKNLEMLLDYLDYSGQNIFSYSFMRYGDEIYSLPGEVNSGWGKYLYEIVGWQSLLLDMLQQRGMKFNIVLNIHAIPESVRSKSNSQELIKEGYLQQGRDGGPVKNFGGRVKANPLHPRYRQELFGHFDEILRRYGKHPAVHGIDLWSSGPGVEADWLVMGLKSGYDDLSVSLFEKDTGIKIPNDSADRYGKRYVALTGQYRKEWLAWCAQKNSKLLGELVARIQAVNPSLTLNIILSGDPVEGTEDDVTSADLDFKKYYYEKFGLDIENLRKVKGLVMTPMRSMTGFRWQMHWNGHYTTTDEVKSDMSRQSLFRYPSGSHVYSYPRYFESYTKSLKQSEYNCMFENADVKPYGRFFLEELSQDMTASDPSVLLIGAQPIGTSGRDEESREFAQAFRALPAVEFKDIEKLKDPISGRIFKSADSTYLSLQNRIYSDLTLVLQGRPDMELRDLSTGNVVPLEKGSWTITFKPFELKALKANRSVEAIVTSVIVPEAIKKEYAELLKNHEELTARLRGYAAETKSYDQQIDLLRQAINENRFAEAHRLAFSKLLRTLPDHMWDARDGFMKRQKEMTDQGRYAVDCGATGYYPSRDKKLFFPDQKYSTGSYGYIGSHNSSSHPVDKLDRAFDKTLFGTEAFELEGYRFTVPNGIYTVKLYNRIGFEPDAKPDMEVMTVEIQGKRVWDRMDLYLATDKDMNKGLVSEFTNVKVTDGVLRIDWIPTDGKQGWCNAIEVYPEAAH